ncbi:MAG: hypothetical protein O3A66_02320, partial [Proteobacteria bacterium]|nr:hypothetical protein [Pseudomonadota bacterium]
MQQNTTQQYTNMLDSDYYISKNGDIIRGNNLPANQDIEIKYGDGCNYYCATYNGKYEHGMLTFPNGSAYSGSFGQEHLGNPDDTIGSERGESENVPSGQGTYIHIHKNEPGQIFSGNWENGIFCNGNNGNGLGVTIYQDRDIRIGNLQGGDFHGNCITYEEGSNKVKVQQARNGNFHTVSQANYR